MSLVVSLAALAGDAQAQYFGRNKVHYDRLDFRVLRTDHFDIYYYAEEELATRHAARMAERWYVRLSRVLDHTFDHRQPLILYASHPHFTQTNISGESPGEGTGGLTERIKSRIAMPFAAGLGETDHILGHEIAHAFQIDIASRAGRDAFTLPAWFIEGMAEYLSVGPSSTHTSMWMRDAALHDRLPALDQLDEGRFFPYRFGHALWTHLTREHGEALLSQVLRSRARDPIARLEEATGLPAADITRQWHRSVETDGSQRPHSIARPQRVLSSQNDDARFHVAPALSPDGASLVFLSERDRLSLDLFLADASTGAVTRKLVSTAADPHFDSLQYIHSSGAWDPAGRRFAFTALTGGDPVLVVMDVAGGTGRIEVPLDGLGEAYNPSWSPDGARIVFSGLKGGLSDLFIYTEATGRVEQLTADAFADLHPAWSPDGRTIALATDRFTSSIDELRFGALRIGLLDLASGVIRPAVEDASPARQVSPQWAPDGQSLYFVSDRSGISNVLRFDVGTRAVHQVTAVAGGVTGITPSSPSLAVSTRAGTLAFSVYRDGRYEIQTLTGARAQAGRAVDMTAAALVPMDEAEDGSMAALLGDPAFGRPPAGDFQTMPYDDRLRLEYLSQPYIGASTGTTFGGAVRANFGAVFSDLLRDRQLQMMARVGTSTEDFAAQIGYVNRKGQWNWGVMAGFAPSRFAGARRALTVGHETITRESTSLRYDNQWASVAARFNIDRGRRFELRTGIRRTGFEWQTITRDIDADTRETLARHRVDEPIGRPVYVGELEAAFVQDTAVSGPTGPVLGQRLRLEVEPAVGDLTYAAVRADVRRYLMPIRPVTLAVRVQHSARYGPGANDPRLTPLLLGLQSVVRGYDMRSYAVDECGGRSATRCALIDELAGSREASMNVELRAPLLGLLTGNLDYGRLPGEGFA
ncbi:MAG: hypothetical protein AB7P99_09130, partial [Vicinamibacterales bacterium]